MANILLIYGHPKTPQSFNFELKEKLVFALRTKGHNVLVRDLYEISFNPLLSSNDLQKLHNNEIPDDIKKEQDFIRHADVIIFIYPIWWAGEPAIIKGYIDRVFSYGFAYKYQGNEVVGLLSDKRAIIINSAGTDLSIYRKTGMYDIIKQKSLQGIFAFCGFKTVKHLIYGGVPKLTSSEKELTIQNAINETIIDIEAK